MNSAVPVLTRLRTEHTALKAQLDGMVSDAARTKTALPNNYWQAEHEARRKVQICMEVAGAIQDEIDGQ